MKPKIQAYYSIFIGIAIIAMWTQILLSEILPEGKLELSFHLFSEFLMATTLIISGILMIKKSKISKELNAAGLGMVTYSVLNAAGYYVQRQDKPMMIFFCLLFTVNLLVLIYVLVKSNKEKLQ